jgi:hypothetical protein
MYNRDIVRSPHPETGVAHRTGGDTERFRNRAPLAGFQFSDPRAALGAMICCMATPIRRTQPPRLARCLLAAGSPHAAGLQLPRPRCPPPGDTTMELHAVRHLSIGIARSPADVYRYAADPEHLPVWASGLARSVRRVERAWVVDSPTGPVSIAFAPDNELGVLDHDVMLPTGATVRNAMRVLPNGTGSEVVFSLFQLPGVSDEQFERDARWVQHDLEALKRALEP